MQRALTCERERALHPPCHRRRRARPAPVSRLEQAAGPAPEGLHVIRRRTRRRRRQTSVPRARAGRSAQRGRAGPPCFQRTAAERLINSRSARTRSETVPSWCRCRPADPGRAGRRAVARPDGPEVPVQRVGRARRRDPPRGRAVWITGMTDPAARAARGQALLEAAEELAQVGSWEWTPTEGESRWSDSVFRDLRPRAGRDHADAGVRGRAHASGRSRSHRRRRRAAALPRRAPAGRVPDRPARPRGPPPARHARRRGGARRPAATASSAGCRTSRSAAGPSGRSRRTSPSPSRSSRGTRSSAAASGCSPLWRRRWASSPASSGSRATARWSRA